MKCLTTLRILFKGAQRVRRLRSDVARPSWAPARLFAPAHIDPRPWAGHDHQSLQLARHEVDAGPFCAPPARNLQGNRASSRWHLSRATDTPAAVTRKDYDDPGAVRRRASCREGRGAL